jgi:hypothetical protein
LGNMPGYVFICACDKLCYQFEFLRAVILCWDYKCDPAKVG